MSNEMNQVAERLVEAFEIIEALEKQLEAAKQLYNEIAADLPLVIRDLGGHHISIVVEHYSVVFNNEFFQKQGASPEDFIVIAEIASRKLD